MAVITFIGSAVFPVGSVLMSGCRRHVRPCADLRIGMTKTQMEQLLGNAVSSRTENGRSNPRDLYVDLTVYSYIHRNGIMAEPDYIYIDERTGQIARISCDDKSIRLKTDGTEVPENYLENWKFKPWVK